LASKRTSGNPRDVIIKNEAGGKVLKQVICVKWGAKFGPHKKQNFSRRIVMPPLPQA
jgi:hypothetical protein